jgi:uncharacterized protein DUF1553/uncharacterized protein DUF1549/cytochrome c
MRNNKITSNRSIYTPIFLVLLLVVCAFSCQPEQKEQINLSAIDYNLHVRPIINKNCIVCHGGVKKSSNLSFLFREEALAVNKSGKRAIVPGDVAKSEMITRIKNQDPEVRMPMDHDPLSKGEIEILVKWVEQGAEWKDHWAFIPPEKTNIPEVKNTEWVNNPIDNFILARLEDEGIAASEEADKTTLIRRAALDITGVPPSIEELNMFLADDSDDAYEKLIDRLLEKPAFGERWTAMWLDLARYADSKGYEADRHREIWKYRDWLIDAFNQDKPFDEFTIEQLAGDLLPKATKDQIIATAFHRNTMNNDEGGTSNEEYRVAAVIDRVNTTWEVWQGVTFSCVQCHSHPYDPIRHEEYYGFYSIFNNTADADLPNEKPVMEVYTKEQEAKIVSIKNWINENGNIASAKKRLDSIKPTTLPIMTELEVDKQRETHVFLKGNWMDKGEKVEAGVPLSMPQLPEGVKPDRLELAKWLVSEENPLTARVTVNRFWSQLFGRGIVESQEDFGSQGYLPSHPALLDWLALQFQNEQEWSMKALVKLMVTSATYKQSSVVTAEHLDKDPSNYLLARVSRTRLNAEQVRDQALAVSGLLSDKMFGPSVMPYQPDGVWQVVYNGKNWKSSEDEDGFRKAIYTYWRRTSPYPSMMSFDSPSREFCVSRRINTNTPLQALVTLNDPVYIEAANALADLTEAHSDIVDEQIKYAFQKALLRIPSDTEMNVMKSLYRDVNIDSEQTDEMKLEVASMNREFLKTPMSVVANAILNLDEFITRQ